MNSQKWLDVLERKIGKIAIPNLMRYIIFGNAIVYVIGLVIPLFPYYLIMDPEEVLHGQVWRLITFIFVPGMGGILPTLLSLFCYYWIGGALERTWGTFKFNFFYWVGVIAIDIVLFIAHFMGESVPIFVHQAGYLSQSMFLALATMYPDVQVLLMFIIPLKAKYMGYFSAALLLYEFIVGALIIKLLILASMVGYMIFFGPELFGRIRAKIRREQYERKMTQGPIGGFSRKPQDYGAAGRAAYRETKKSPQQGKVITGVAFHHCTVCGITELDDPNMTFRYCSQCNGNYEYCENHIHNHQHIQ